MRTLPIRLAPLHGEALDSWLEALAARLNTSFGELLGHVGIPTLTTASTAPGPVSLNWAVALSARETAALAWTSGLDPAVITRMTLAHYDGRAVHINLGRRRVNHSLLWGRGWGSRFCPDCLHDLDGRWRLVWRLGWAFACPLHRRLLADCCPDCGRIQRQRIHPGKAIPELGRCGVPPSRGGGAFSAGCGFDLTQAPTLPLPPGHPALAAQEQLLGIIDSATACFGVYTPSPQPAHSALADIRAISGRVLANLADRVIMSLVPGDIGEAHVTPDPDSPLATRAGRRPGFRTPARAASTAVAVIIALRVLRQPNIHQGGQVMRGLLEAMRDELTVVSATSLDGWGSGLSPVLHAVYLAALASSLRPSEQLRYRTPTTMPRRPNLTSRGLTHRARTIPSMFWPYWTVRLSPAIRINHRFLAPVLASSLLVIGGRANLNEVAELLGAGIAGSDVSRILQLLKTQPHWPRLVVGLDRLANHLDTHDVPIDYQRRRGLNYTALLPGEHWQRICRDTGTPAGHGFRERVVRCALFQRISGLPLDAAPDYRAARHSRFYTEGMRLATAQTPALAQALDTEAREFLATLHIHGEPMTWQPPTHLLDGLELPGPDPAQIDIPRLHQLVHQHRHPMGRTARTLGTSIEAVRHVLAEHPAPTPPSPSLASAKVTGQIRFAARQKVPKQTLARLYLDQARPLSEIAELTGLSRQILTRLAHDYDIPLRPAHARRRATIEREWLIEQYLIRRRTLSDLAREKNMSAANMARWAHTHNIPIRPRGGVTPHACFRVDDDFPHAPAILRDALTSRYARWRVENFTAVLPYPSLTEAAQALGIKRQTLTKRIARLEQDLGQPLLERADRYQTMKLTPFGNQVATAIRQAHWTNPAMPHSRR